MTNLTTLAQKMMRINERASLPNRNPSAIFGSIGDLPQAVSSRAPLRIGMWPCISEEKPEFAMGIWSLLGHLLERWDDIEVYRLFVQLENDPEDYSWSIEQSQFTPADWDIEPLDENIGLWGTLQQADDKWELTATIDNDNLTGEDNEAILLSVSADTMPALIGALPVFAREIADTIAAGREDTTDPMFEGTQASEDTLLLLMKALLMWDVNLVAYLYGVEWDDPQIISEYERMLDAGKTVGDDFAAWAVAKSINRTMRPGYSVIGDLFVDRVEKVRETIDSLITMPILAGGVFNMGFAQRAYRLLETEVEAHPESTTAHLKLAGIYAAGGLLEDAVLQYQDAINIGSVSADLYRAYGNVLLMAEQENQLPTSFALIQPANYNTDYPAWEAVAAYDKAVELNQEDYRALYSGLLQLAEIAEDESVFWDRFIQLVELDDSGEYIRDVTDGLYVISDVERGIDALKVVSDKYPERIDPYINSAALYLAVDDGENAAPYLKKAREMSDDISILADIERLQLTVRDADFEFRFAEMVGVLDAKNALGADDVEYLETVVDEAPHVVDAHIALARAYYFWEETDDALEVLLDAQESVPDRPDVLDWLARILWESGAQETAFQYLNRGMRLYPFNVQLIARAGQYLFDNDQLEEARAYLSRAEDISPRHPMLKAVRAYVARKIADEPEKYSNFQS